MVPHPCRVVASGGPVQVGVGSRRGHRLESPPPGLGHFRNNPPQGPGEAPAVHGPRHFCPSWKLSINDRVQFPGAARELMVGSVLPRDKRWMELAAPAELQDMYYTAQAQVSSLAHGLVLPLCFSWVS